MTCMPFYQPVDLSSLEFGDIPSDGLEGREKKSEAKQEMCGGCSSTDLQTEPADKITPAGINRDSVSCKFSTRTLNRIRAPASATTSLLGTHTHTPRQQYNDTWNSGNMAKFFSDIWCLILSDTGALSILIDFIGDEFLDAVMVSLVTGHV